jgi:putative transposase
VSRLLTYGNSVMYTWRSLSEKDRNELLDYRKKQKLPWHSPPRIINYKTHYLITAACYEHKHILGTPLSRIETFEKKLLKKLETLTENIFAWVILPNHYHILIQTKSIITVLRAIGKIHGATSHQWNGEENKRGRKVWCGAAETVIKSERHFYATLNYIHHNPVRHRYVTQWIDWPFSSAHQFFADLEREEVNKLWKEYPIDQYGKEWDPPDM